MQIKKFLFFTNVFSPIFYLFVNLTSIFAKKIPRGIFLPPRNFNISVIFSLLFHQICERRLDKFCQRLRVQEDLFSPHAAAHRDLFI